MTGIRASAGSPRMASSTAKPSSSGMTRSSSTTSIPAPSSPSRSSAIAAVLGLDHLVARARRAGARASAGSAGCRRRRGSARRPAIAGALMRPTARRARRRGRPRPARARLARRPRPPRHRRARRAGRAPRASGRSRPGAMAPIVAALPLSVWAGTTTRAGVAGRDRGVDGREEARRLGEERVDELVDERRVVADGLEQLGQDRACRACQPSAAPVATTGAAAIAAASSSGRIGLLR